MPRLQRCSGKEAVSALERLGFSIDRQRGSHVIMKNFTQHPIATCVVPMHKELALGTLKSVLRQANIDVEKFTAALED